jgi:N-glycosylase/DNA lyase
MEKDSWFPLTRAGQILDLNLTLPAGQVFCWDYDSDRDEWMGVVDQTAYWLRQGDDGRIKFRFASDDSTLTAETACIQLHAFFQLDIDLEILLSQWSSNCEIFNRLVPPNSPLRTGLRICKQSPFECLISFIVSANNHIKRINSNLKSIRAKYGGKIHNASGNDLFRFPTLHELSTATEEELRDIGLGYRAGYIVKTCKILITTGTDISLFRKEEDIDLARKFLMSLAGVGRKVADCVCLYSLDFPAVAPVDTHMYQIAQKMFKSIPKDKYMHDTIQKLMIERFGDTAGWAHCFLFAADLKPTSESPEAKRIRARE